MNAPPLPVLFVDGVGGRRFMRGPLVRHFQRHGHAVTCFDYRAAREPLAAAQQRLHRAVADLARQGDYLAIGYSFGGVLLRAVLAGGVPPGWGQAPPALAPLPPPRRLALLASPVHAVGLAARFRHWRLYRLLTGEMGEFAADEAAMATVPWPTVPVACVYGTWPWLGLLGLFDGFGPTHDGLVTVHEAQPQRAEHAVAVAASHGFIPQNRAALQALQHWLADTPPQG